MTVHSLLHNIIVAKRPHTTLNVSLKQLATEVHERSSGAKKAELLCDFSSVVRWVLSRHDREQIQHGKLSPYSTLHGGDFNMYSECMYKFVESIEQLGIQLVFFIDGPPGSKKEELESNFERYKEDALRTQEACASMEQICAGNKDVLQTKWTLTEMVSIQVQYVLRDAGVFVICCPGQSLSKMAQYSKSHDQVIGVVSNNIELPFFVHGLKVIAPDLISQGDATPVGVLSGGHCEAVSSTSLASAFGITEHHLSDLAILCQCDDSMLVELGLGIGTLEALVKWLQIQEEPISGERYPKYAAIKRHVASQFLLLPQCEDELASDAEQDSSVSCELSNEKPSSSGEHVKSEAVGNSLAEIVRLRVQNGSMMPHLLSIVEGRYWRNSAVELASLGQPCINDLTLCLRKSLYSMMGLKSVTEYGQTSTRAFDTIAIELKACIDCGVTLLQSLEERSQNERLSLLFDLVGNAQYYQETEKLHDLVFAACQVGSDIAEPMSGSAVMVCAALLLLFQSNEIISCFPQIKYFELDALLVTCLTCVAGYSPCVLQHRPPVCAVSTGMYFSHILEQIYIIASYLGLSGTLPAPAHLFYSMAYVPYYVAGLSEVTKVTPSHVDGPSMTMIQDLFSSLQNLEPVLALRAEIINGSKNPNLPRLLQLFSSSVDAVNAYREQRREEESSKSSLPLKGGFNLRIDRTDDTELSSSFNSDSSVFGKCNELSSAQEYEASEEDLYFASKFGDVIDGDANDDVMADDDDNIGDGDTDDSVFLMCDVEQTTSEALDSDSERAKQQDAPEKLSADLVDDGHAPVSGEEGLLSAEEGHLPTKTCTNSDAEPRILTSDCVAHDKIESDVKPSFPHSNPPHPHSHHVISPRSPRHSDPLYSHSHPDTPHPRSIPNPVRKEEEEKQELPVMIHRERIIELVRNHRVVCIEGETGCGKSTKIPQFILDDSLKNNPAVPCRIIVTQPRRVAVVKLAERVAAERKERIGQSVGYCIGGERNRTSETSLTYCTVGYLLQALVYNPSMILRYTHIILDEIHERSTDADFALIIVRKLLASSTNLKVVIMSATMESSLITSYFEQMVNFTDIADPYFVGAKCYKVNSYFIDELDKLADSKKSVWSEWQAVALSNLKRLILKQPPENLQEAMTRDPAVTVFAQSVCTEVIISQANLGEQILVFLPGIYEIGTYYDILTKVIEERKLADHFIVFVMHSQVPFEDQKEVFKPPSSNVAHVILATNIAESSITLPRLRLVINFGIYRQLEYNSKRHVTVLTKKWCSHASCKQRAGRAGRVFEGVAVHLFTKRFFWVIAPEFDPPEILNAPLAKLVLQAKQIGSKMGVPSPSEFLSHAMDPPSLEQMELALKELASFGAIVSQPGSPVSEEAEITLLGQFTLTLPLDIEFSRLVLYGIFFGIPTDAIIIAAAASISQDVFSLPSRMVLKDEDTYRASLRRSMVSRYHYDAGEYSDSVMLCNMFREWIECKNHCSMNTSLKYKYSFLRQFCINHSLRWQRLLQLEHSIAEIAARVLPLIPKEYHLYDDIRALSDITSYRRGYSFMSDMEEEGNGNGGRKYRRLRLSVVTLHFCEDANIIKALMVAAFIHNVILGHRGSESPSLKENMNTQSALAVMSHLGYNPAETVMFRSDHTASRADVHTLVTTVLPRRFSEFKIVDRFWYVHLHPEFSKNPKTSLMRAQEEAKQEDKASSSSAVQDSSSVICHTLSTDICYFWQYGERKAMWKVADANFTKPQHPFEVSWTRISKEKEKVLISSWRNPSGLVCEVGQECSAFLGVVSFVQGIQHRNVISGRGVTVLPSLSRGKEALLMLLAFQPQDVKIDFSMNQGAITGLKIDSFNLPLPGALLNRISSDDLVRINELRKAMSQVLRLSGELRQCLPIEEISTIHALLKCVLTGSPPDLTCPMENAPPLTMSCKLSQQLDHVIDHDDSEFEFDDEETIAIDSTVLLTVFQLYPPIKCRLLDVCTIRPIRRESLEIDQLFRRKSGSEFICRGMNQSSISSSSYFVQRKEVNQNQVVELEEFDELDQPEKHKPLLQEEDTASFRLSPLAEPFVPKDSNVNPLLTHPPPPPPSPISSHSQQYQSIPIHGDGHTVQELSLHNVHNLPVHNVQTIPFQNVPSIPTNECTLQDAQQQQIGYSVVGEYSQPVGTAPTNEAAMSCPSFYGAESLVPPVLPMGPPVNPEAVHKAYQTLLQILDSAFKHPGERCQEIQQAKILCQFLMSNAVQNQSCMQPLGEINPVHQSFPSECRPQSEARECEGWERSSSIAVQSLQSTCTSDVVVNDYGTDVDKKSDFDGDGSEVAKTNYSNQVITDTAASHGERQCDSVQEELDIDLMETVPPRKLRSPTTGLVEQHMDDEDQVGRNSRTLESANDGGSNESSPPTAEDAKRDKEDEISPSLDRSPVAQAASVGKDRERNSETMLSETSLDIVHDKAEIEQLVKEVKVSNNNELQGVLRSNHPSGAVVLDQGSIGNTLYPPLTFSSQPATSLLSSQAAVPQMHVRLTKSEMCLSDASTTERRSGLHVSPPEVRAGYLSQLTQALLSPSHPSPLRSPPSIPLPLPLSQVMKSPPSSPLLVPPEGPSPISQRSPTSLGLVHHSNPTLPGGSLDTSRAYLSNSSPSLFHGGLSVNHSPEFCQRSAPFSFPNQHQVQLGTSTAPNRHPLTTAPVLMTDVIQRPHSTDVLDVAQSHSGGQRSESLPPAHVAGQIQTLSRLAPPGLHARKVSDVSLQKFGQSSAAPRHLSRPRSTNVPPRSQGRRSHTRENKQRHAKPLLRYEGPPQSSGSKPASLPYPPGLGCPLPVPPHHQRHWGKPPPPPPPHPSLMMNYTARHKIPPLIPVVLPGPPSSAPRNQASGLHVLPLKYNRSSSNNKERPSYEQYGIPREVLAKCYCTLLAAKGMDLELNMLCGPYYRDILKCYRVCARENEVLEPCFFDKCSHFTVYGEPGHYMVKLNLVSNSNKATDSSQTQTDKSADASLTQSSGALITQHETTDTNLTQSEISDLTQPETTDVLLTQGETDVLLKTTNVEQPEITDVSLKQTDPTDAQLKTTLGEPENSISSSDTQPEAKIQLVPEDAVQTQYDTSLVMTVDAASSQSEANEAFQVLPTTTDPLLTQSETTDALQVQSETTDALCEITEVVDPQLSIAVQDSNIQECDSHESHSFKKSDQHKRENFYKESKLTGTSQDIAASSKGFAGDEEREASVTGFDDDCWIESGQPATYTVTKSEASTKSETEPSKVPTSVYDEDCWQESAPPECENIETSASLSFNPIRILKREDSDCEPFVSRKDKHKRSSNSQPSSKGATDSVSGRAVKDVKDEQSSTEKFKRSKKSKNKRNKRRSMREDSRSERYSPAPCTGGSAGSGWTSESSSMAGDRREGRRDGRMEQQRYYRGASQRFKRQGSGDRPRRAGESSWASKDFESRCTRMGESSLPSEDFRSDDKGDEGDKGDRRLTKEFRRRAYYGPPWKRYGSGCGLSKSQPEQKK